MKQYGKFERGVPLAAWALLAVFAAMSMGCGRTETQGNTDSIVDSMIFARTGLLLKTGGREPIKKTIVFQDGRKKSSAVGTGSSDEIWVDLQWRPNKTYELNVTTDKATLKIPVTAPTRPSPVKIAEIPLEELDKGEMEYLYYAWRGAQVKFSPDGTHIGVGSKGGYVYLISVPEKKIQWKHKIPEGRVAKVAFTGDGKLIAGEESCDGNVYCFDVNTGKVLWTYRSADHFEGPKGAVTRRGMFKNYPFMCWGLCMGKDNSPYVMVRHTHEATVDGRLQSVTTSLVCKLDIATGKAVWTFPVPTSAWGLKISRDGRYLFPAVGWAEEAVLSVLDTTSGKPLWQHTFTCPADRSRSRWGTGFEGDISPDGRYLVINQLFPNITFVFDNQKSIQSGRSEVVWRKQFFKTLDVGGVPISTHSIHLNLTRSEIIFSTYSAREMGRIANRAASPAQHPDADTLFVYDYAGRLKWKWKMGDGTWNSEGALAADDAYLVIPLGIVPENTLSNPEEMGVYVFNLPASGGATAKLNWFYHTGGFAYKVDISPDGRHIAVLEGPFDIDPDRMRENIVGTHRLLILS